MAGAFNRRHRWRHFQFCHYRRIRLSRPIAWPRTVVCSELSPDIRDQFVSAELDFVLAKRGNSGTSNPSPPDEHPVLYPNGSICFYCYKDATEVRT